MTALALRDDQTEWDKQQLAVLEANGIDSDVTEPELMAFLHECQRRKLDPFSRQIYLIGRWDNRKGRKVYRSQTSIDGFRLIARRAADKSGIDYSYEDTIWYDADGGRHEIWLSPQPPAGAKVVVIRNGQRFDAVARSGAYVQMDRNGNPTGMWRNMADVMIAKCAEALALRKAFPEDLGGIYTEEEMAQADNPQRVTATVEVVRDEPAPEAPAENAWLAAAMEQAPKHATLEACQVMWRKSAEMVKDKEITRADADRLRALLFKRMEELKDAPPAPETDGEVVDAEIVEDGAGMLDGDWADKVADITSDEDGAFVTGEANDLLGSGEISDDLHRQIHAAVEARLAALAPKAA